MERGWCNHWCFEYCRQHTGIQSYVVVGSWWNRFCICQESIRRELYLSLRYDGDVLSRKTKGFILWKLYRRLQMELLSLGFAESVTGYWKIWLHRLWVFSWRYTGTLCGCFLRPVWSIWLWFGRTTAGGVPSFEKVSGWSVPVCLEKRTL